MTPLLLLSLARLATSQISFPAFGNDIIGFIWLEMIGYVLEGFDFSGLSQPQFSLNIQNDETDFHQQQQQFSSSVELSQQPELFQLPSQGNQIQQPNHHPQQQTTAEQLFNEIKLQAQVRCV